MRMSQKMSLHFEERTVRYIIDEILTFVNKKRILVKKNVLFVKKIDTLIVID